MVIERAQHAGSPARGIALAALLIAAGNIASRLLGLARVTAIALFFGRSAGVDAYAAAWVVPNTIYDVLIAGAVSAVFVPVFSEYAEGDRGEFGRVVSGVVTCVLLLLLALIALLAWQAPLAARLLIQASRPDVYAQTVHLIRLLLPAVLLMGLAGMATAILHAQRKFLLPATIGAIFNAGVILGAALLHDRLGVASLAVGAAVGALGQVAIQALGLRGLRYRPALNLRHPAMRRIARLYAPVALGIVFLIAGTIVDRRLASGFPAALATMQYATTLIQFPLALVAAAIARAVLPTLSRQSAAANQAAFSETLAIGLKVVLLLVTPATIGLAALAVPITALLFERGAFGAADTLATARALWFYLPGLPAIAVAQLLIFAFYARKNTLIPSLAQGAAIGLYLLTALALLRSTRLGFLGLVLANSAQWIGHMLLLAILLWRVLPLRGARLGEALAKTAAAGALMAIVMLLLVGMVHPATPGHGALASIAITGGLGALCYVGACVALRVEALEFFVQVLAKRVRAGPSTK
jgi:putative peptidoglycan lipid II flippase